MKNETDYIYLYLKMMKHLSSILLIFTVKGGGGEENGWTITR